MSAGAQLEVIPSRLAGRCANGAEADGGRIYHAVVRGSWSALCGAKPGRRSAGWSSYPGETVTCSRCAKRLEAAQLAARSAVI